MSSKFKTIALILLIILFCPIVSLSKTYEDALGRTVTLNKTPKRIISLAPSLTEILYYLGLGERVVGVTQFSYYPPEAANKPKVGSYIKLNAERIISLSPDLVIGTADGNQPGTISLLEQANIPVYIVNPRKVREAIGTIRTVGELCTSRGRAGELSSALDRRVDAIFEQTSSLRKPLVFLQINVRPIMTVNRHTFHHDVIRLAGGDNMAEDESVTYPRTSIEEIIRKKPEVIVISSMERGGKFERSRRGWMKWTSIPAVKTGRVHLVDSDLLDRPSPRIVKGLEIMARLLHPEVAWRTAD